LRRSSNPNPKPNPALTLLAINNIPNPNPKSNPLTFGIVDLRNIKPSEPRFRRSTNPNPKPNLALTLLALNTNPNADPNPKSNPNLRNSGPVSASRYGPVERRARGR